MARELVRRLRSWEGLLLVFLLVVLAYNVTRVPNFLTVSNQVNLFQLGIEKAIVVLIMTFVIISGEIDLSVASMMGLSAAITGSLYESGAPMPLAILVALGVGAAFGLLNGYFVAVVGLSSPWRDTSGSGVWRGSWSRTVPSAGSRTGSPTWGNTRWSDH
jgi:rhamnose transport system permease protein